MNFIILFTVLLLVVAADKDADYQQPQYLRTRELVADGEMCVHIVGGGGMTVHVSGYRKWFLGRGVSFSSLPLAHRFFSLMLHRQRKANAGMKQGFLDRSKWYSAERSTKSFVSWRLQFHVLLGIGLKTKTGRREHAGKVLVRQILRELILYQPTSADLLSIYIWKISGEYPDEFIDMIYLQ